MAQQDAGGGAYLPLGGHGDDDNDADAGSDTIALGPSALGLPKDEDDTISAPRARAVASHQGFLFKKRERCLGFCKPEWSQRYYVLSGRLFCGFASPDSSRMQGAPLALEGMDVRALDDEALPFAFLVSTLSEAVVLAAVSEASRDAWVNALRMAKLRAIKEILGHTAEQNEHRDLNRIGSKLIQRRWLGRKRGAEDALHPMVEMQTLGGGGGVGGFVDPHY